MFLVEPYAHPRLPDRRQGNPPLGYRRHDLIHLVSVVHRAGELINLVSGFHRLTSAPAMGNVGATRRHTCVARRDPLGVRRPARPGGGTPSGRCQRQSTITTDACGVRTPRGTCSFGPKMGVNRRPRQHTCVVRSPESAPAVRGGRTPFARRRSAPFAVGVRPTHLLLAAGGGCSLRLPGFADPVSSEAQS